MFPGIYKSRALVRNIVGPLSIASLGCVPEGSSIRRLFWRCEFIVFSYVSLLLAPLLLLRWVHKMANASKFAKLFFAHSRIVRSLSFKS